MAIAVAGVTLVLCAAIVLRARTDSGIWESRPWIRALGSDTILGVDPASAWIAAFVAVLVLAAIVSSSPSSTSSVTAARALFAESMALGLFFARDTMLMLSFYGGAVLALALWVESPGARRKFLVYQLIGLTFWLGFFVQCFHLVFVETGFVSTELARWHALVLYPERERSLFLVALAGAAFAMPLFPMSGWLRDTFETLPRAGRLLLFGVFSLVGSHVLFRLVLPMCPLGVARASGLVLGVALLSILYAAMMPGCALARLLVGGQGLVLLGVLATPEGGHLDLERLAVAVGMAGLVGWRAAPARFVFASVLVVVPLVRVVPAAWHASRLSASCMLVAAGLLAIRLVRDRPAAEASP